MFTVSNVCILCSSHVHHHADGGNNGDDGGGVCICVYACMCAHGHTHMWRSEDNVEELFSASTVGSGDQTQTLRCVQQVLFPKASSPRPSVRFSVLLTGIFIARAYSSFFHTGHSINVC